MMVSICCCCGRTSTVSHSTTLGTDLQQETAAHVQKARQIHCPDDHGLQLSALRRARRQVNTALVILDVWADH
jgi:hypothetical protein